MAHLYISAAHKSSGKTTVSVGLAAALTKRRNAVQTFKKGPDYIDPLWLQKATNRPCYNLDFNTQSPDEIVGLFGRHLAGADIGVIEGNKGLYDGVALDGHDSNAAMAVLLQAPVILVIDVNGITRGIAPLLMGYQAFGAEVEIAGVIFNKVASTRQEDKLRASVEHYTDMAVVGSISRNDRLLAPERHLGLVPPDESKRAFERIDELVEIMEKSVNLDQLTKIAQAAPALEKQQSDTRSVENTSTVKSTNNGVADLRIGVARDSAFGFYYSDDLEALENAGAELIFFNTLQDQNLPVIDGLFLGGGFPETHLKGLQDNKSLRQQIKKAAQNGLPIYAECGGLMYLANSIHWQGQAAQMVGVIPGDVTMHQKPQGRGLVQLRETQYSLWGGSQDGDGSKIIKAHEFHYASLDNLPADTRFAHEVIRGHGINGTHDSIVLNNVQAGFCHHRSTKQNDWAGRFVEFVRHSKQS